MGSTQMFQLIWRREATFLLIVTVFALVETTRSYSQDAFDTVIEVSGKLKAVRGNMLTITRDDETEVAVRLHADPTQLVFSANAKPQWIRVGMLVRVEAAFGPNGQPVQPIDTVEIFQVFPGAGLPAHSRERYTPGVVALDKEPADGQQRAGFQAGRYRIVGPITAMGPEGIMVNAGSTRVPLPIAAEAKWLIRNHDLDLAEPGDVVKVTGFHQPPDETKIMANTVRVDVERVYGDPSENDKVRKRTRKTPASRPKAAPAEAPAQDDATPKP